MDARVTDLFDLANTRASAFLAGFTYPWEALPHIAGFVSALGPTLPADEFEQVAPDIWVARDAEVAPTASLAGPLVIDHGAQVRHCAFVRGSALIGRGVVVGNSCEVKNSILFDGAQTPHFNYIGDSILGAHAHMGAGAVTSNLKSDHSLVVVRDGSCVVQTGLRKFGAILGDDVEVGCNAVLCPGTVIGRGTRVYPLCRVRGFVGANRIFKDPGDIVEMRTD